MLLVLCILIVLTAVGSGVFHAAQHNESAGKRSNRFFIVCYVRSLAVLIIGVAIALYTTTLIDEWAEQWAEFVAFLIGSFVAIVGVSSVVAVTGGLVVHLLKKKRDKQKLSDTPES